jgi:hypothetical protein
MGELGLRQGVVITVAFGPNGRCSTEFDDPVLGALKHVVGASVGGMLQTSETIHATTFKA